MLRFQSIISRIVFLHVVAVVITSILMSLALSWLLSYATDNIHNKAMQEQAVTVGEHLSVGPDGRLELNLPLRPARALFAGLWPLFLCRDRRSRRGAVLLAARITRRCFPTTGAPATLEFLQQRRGDATVSGASVKKTVGGQTVWIQAGEDLANRDVLIDDIVADFYRTSAGSRCRSCWCC